MDTRNERFEVISSQKSKCYKVIQIPVRFSPLYFMSFVSKNATFAHFMQQSFIYSSYSTQDSASLDKEKS